MPTIRFIGSVDPPAVNVSLGSFPYGISNHLQLGLESKWELRIIDSNVTIIADLNKFDLNTHLRPTINHAHDIASIATNLLSLQSGVAFSVSLDKLIMPSGEMHWVHCKELEFPKHMTAIRQPSDFEKSITTAVANHDIAMAIRDITDCLRQSYTGTISAARSMEGICNTFVPAGGTREEGWPLMRVALNVTEKYLKSITNQSRGPRHANWSQDQQEPEARATTERAWILMNRFLEYKKRDNQQLSVAEA